MTLDFNPYPSEDTESMPLRVTRDPMETPSEFRYTLWHDALQLLGLTMVIFLLAFGVLAAMSLDPWGDLARMWAVLGGAK